MTRPTKMTPKQRIADAHVNLLVAEAQWLERNGWQPSSPTTPGGDVLWLDPALKKLHTQDEAIALQKQRAATE